MKELLMVRFGELSTKGKNKKDFIARLAKNIKNSLKEFEGLTFDVKYDHIYVDLNGMDYHKPVEVLQDVSGIRAISLVYKVDKDIEIIKSSCLELVKTLSGKTFKVNCKRADKQFPLVSDEIVRKVAPVILKNTELKVDVHNPDINLSIEVRGEATYIFTQTFPGAGGYPLGVGGKAMLMMSGGIDSPVAAYLMMKRGVTIECIHFASPPYTQIGVIYKLEDLLNKLNRYQENIILHIVPFTKIQEAIYANSNESYAITIMRRMMYRLSDALAKKRRCPAIVNGESIGQVASQTLVSMNTINDVTNMPVIRPLAIFDKLQIIDISKKIDTYDISIRPYEDCCTIFTPKNPKTAPKIEDVVKFEEKFDWQSLLDEALENVETRVIKKEEVDF